MPDEPSTNLRWWYVAPPATFLVVSALGAALTLADGPFNATELEAMGVWLGALCTVGAISAAFYQLAEQRRFESRQRAAAEDAVDEANLRAVRIRLERIHTGRHLPGPTADHARSVEVRFDITVRHLGPHPVLDLSVDLAFSADVLLQDGTVATTFGDDGRQTGRSIRVRLGDLAPGERCAAEVAVGYLMDADVTAVASVESTTGRSRGWAIEAKAKHS